MTDEPLTGEALLEKLRKQLPLLTTLPFDASEEQIAKHTGVSFTEQEQNELARVSIGNPDAPLTDETRSIHMEIMRHKLASDLLRQHGVDSLDDLPKP